MKWLAPISKIFVEYRDFKSRNYLTVSQTHQNKLPNQRNKSKKNQFLSKILYILLRRVSEMVGANQYFFCWIYGFQIAELGFWLESSWFWLEDWGILFGNLEFLFVDLWLRLGGLGLWFEKLVLQIVNKLGRFVDKFGRFVNKFFCPVEKFFPFAEMHLFFLDLAP